MVSTVRWISQVADRGVAAVAQALGMQVDPDGIRPCPACTSEHRSRNDRRPPVDVVARGRGWICYRCAASGDAVTLAAIVTLGERLAAKDPRWKRVRQRCAEEGLCDSERGQGPGGRTLRAKAPAPLPPPRRTLPPADEIAALWAACTPAAEDPAVSRWLRSRGLDPGALGSEVRALPTAYPWAAWCPPWLRSRRAVLPAWDASGALRSLRFRAVGEVSGPKAAPPSGKADPRVDGPYTVGGLVLADVVARWLLEGRADLLGDAWDGRVIVVEGEPDFLTWAQHAPDATRTPAVFGVWSGSWTPDIAARIPDGSPVVIRTHHDRDGDKYAHAVTTTLQGRCRVFRSRPLAEAA